MGNDLDEFDNQNEQLQFMDQNYAEEVLDHMKDANDFSPTMQQNSEEDEEREKINERIVATVAHEVMDEQVNRSLNTILAQYKSKFRKHEVDRIRDEAKMTIRGFLSHLVKALCQNDSDQWYSVLGIHEPNDYDLDAFLDMCEKTEEIFKELSFPETLGTGLGPHALPQASH